MPRFVSRTANRVLGFAQIFVIGFVLVYAALGFIGMQDVHATELRSVDMQQPTTMFEQNLDDRVTDNNRRIAAIEAQDFNGRMIKLESTTESIMRIMFAILAGVLGLLTESVTRLLGVKRGKQA